MSSSTSVLRMVYQTSTRFELTANESVRYHIVLWIEIDTFKHA